LTRWRVEAGRCEGTVRDVIDKKAYQDYPMTEPYRIKAKKKSLEKYYGS
jgi:hypothetical protein